MRTLALLICGLTWLALASTAQASANAVFPNPAHSTADNIGPRDTIWGTPIGLAPSAIFEIRNQRSGTLLTAPGTGPGGHAKHARDRVVAQRDSDDPKDMVKATTEAADEAGQWQIHPRFSGGYRIVNEETGEALGVWRDSTGDMMVVTKLETKNIDLDWMITRNDDGSYQIVNEQSGKVLARRGRSGAAGAMLVRAKEGRRADEAWLLQRVD